jgi:hypothetical protein
MSNRHTAGFDPAALKQLYIAFDSAWDAVKESPPIETARVRAKR